MVHQKPVNFLTKSKVRKNLKLEKKTKSKDLAGSREAQAMETLQTIFMKSLAQKSNLIAFQKRKNIVDQKTLLAGAKDALNVFSIDGDGENREKES